MCGWVVLFSSLYCRHLPHSFCDSYFHIVSSSFQWDIKPHAICTTRTHTHTEQHNTTCAHTVTMHTPQRTCAHTHTTSLSLSPPGQPKPKDGMLQSMPFFLFDICTCPCASPGVRGQGSQTNSIIIIMISSRYSTTRGSTETTQTAYAAASNASEFTTDWGGREREGAQCKNREKATKQNMHLILFLATNN